ncbi:reverse transcriptase domain-containing protein [Tanacetum coccineum]
MADNRTMTQLLRAPTKGYEDAIVIPEINANFELKHGLINLVQNKQFLGHDKDDPHAHISYFNKITSTMRFPDIPSTSIKLMLFLFSLEGLARIWLKKEPPRSILTWDDLVSKFINQFFPPSKTTNLRNEITRFQQRFDKSFYEAWDRFNDLLRACPHHGFSELHQLDTPKLIDKQKAQAPVPVKAVEQSCVTYGGAHSYRNCPATDGNVYRDNIQEYVSQAAAANFNQGNTNSRPPMVANQIRPPGFPPIQNNQNRFNQNQGNNFNQNRGTNFNQNRGNNFYQGQVYQPPTSQPPVYQAHPYQAPAPQMQGVSKTDFENYVKANDAILRNMQNQGQGLQNQMTNLTEMLSKFVNSNTASTSSSGSLPSNTVTNPKEDLKGITTRSGVAYQGPTIPTSSPKVVERRTEVTKDTVFPTNNGITEDVQPPVVPVENQNPVSEPVDAPVSAPMPNPKPSIPYPSRRVTKLKLQYHQLIEPPEVELKDLPPHLEYAFLEDNNKLPVIIAKDLSVDEKTALIKVLKSRKRAIAWKLSDIKGINPEFCSHKILMEEDYEPAVQHQRSPWVSPVHCVPKKGGMTVVTNDENELVPTRLVTGWRVCIDYRKLNEATRKDHFPLPFMDQMLERLAGNEYYCFLDGFSGYFQIPIDPKDQEKTTFTCPYGMHVPEKNTPFQSLEECIQAFQTLKKKLTEAPILIAPDWDQPFELMCDVSDNAIGAVLGQQIEKHFRPIHYASKTMTEAESNYTTTEKEMLAVVYAFEKFRSYLIMNKSIVYTDHSALKYLFAKKDQGKITKMGSPPSRV